MLRFPVLLFIASLACTSLLHADDVTPEAIVQGNLLAPKAFRAAVAKIRPSIVAIETFGGVSGAGKVSFKPGEGPTTGVILSADGLIVTSTFNFLERPPIITVIFADGRRKIAKLLGRDDTRKLCLLRVEGEKNLPVPALVDPAELKVGRWVTAAGLGFGGDVPAVSSGIISALHRVSGKAVQTDANLSPANYGGPLVDIEGKLVGICVPLSPDSRETTSGAEWYDSGIGFAVPLTGIESVVAAMTEGKQFRHGYLGIQAKSQGDPPRGVFVTKVMKGSAGEAGGIKEGDEIKTIDGVEAIDPTYLGVRIGRYFLGDKVKLEVQRGTQPAVLEITLGEMPKPDPRPMKEPDPEDKDKGKEPMPKVEPPAEIR